MEKLVQNVPAYVKNPKVHICIPLLHPCPVPFESTPHPRMFLLSLYVCVYQVITSL